MDSKLDPAKFDILKQIVENYTAPTSDIRISMDEKSAREYAALEEQIENLGEDDPLIPKLKKLANKLRKAVLDSSVIVHLKAVDDDTAAQWREDASNKFPEWNTDSEQNIEWHQRFQHLSFCHHIIDIETSDGAHTGPLDEPAADFFRTSLSSNMKARIFDGIDNLYNDANKGFEDAVKGVDFS